MNKAMKTSILKVGAASVALLVVGNVMAAVTGDVTMSINDPNYGTPNSAFCEYASLNASLGGHTIIDGGEWIGIYSFTVQNNGGYNIPSTFYSTCISPTGRLYDGQYTYNRLSFQDASPGMNPAAWAPGGIQNANYLFQQYSSGIINHASGQGLIGSGADQGAALALAMYAALYNSQGYGNAWNPITPITDPTRAFALIGANAAVTADYNAILGALMNWSPSTGDLANGYVLRPTETSAQDMLLLGPNTPHGGVVPEPTTMIAGFGALGLLLFGAGVHSKRPVLLIGK